MYIEIEGSDIDDFIHQRVILFGAGSCGLHAVEEFEKRSIEIIAFCDNNLSLIGKQFEGYPVIQPNKLLDYPDISIIITSTFHNEIKEQLYNMGVKKIYVAKVGVLRKTIDKNQFHNHFLSKEEANDFIYKGLTCKNPFFVGRLGSVELETLTHYLYFLDRRSKKSSKKEYPANVRAMMNINAGFFPSEDNLLDKFSKLYINNMNEIDLIWSMWLSEFEDMIYHDFYKDKLVTAYDESYLPIDFSFPWTKAIEGKKVLVIHPFDQSINENYKIKEKLFSNKEFLPDFELITFKAIQSIAGTYVNFKDWFHALEYMENCIEKINFEIAFVGAGAYGFPLSAFIKKIGKKAIHMGGALQLYFGIKGKAWNKLGIYNEFWTSPKEAEKPERFKWVENGRYW